MVQRVDGANRRVGNFRTDAVTVEDKNFHTANPLSVKTSPR